MTPNKMREGFVPTSDKIFTAIRRCKSHFSMAKASIKPPRNKKIMLSVYCCATNLLSEIPKAGKKIIGSKAVTASGTASLNHQIDIHIAMPAIKVVALLPESKSTKSHNKIATKGPANKKMYFFEDELTLTKVALLRKLNDEKT